MKHTDKKYPEIEELKNHILNISLILGTSFGFIVYILSLNRYTETGFEIAFVTDFITLLALTILTIYRKRLSINIKAYVAIGAIYVLFLFDVIRLGVFSADKVLIILIPFASFLVFSTRKATGIFTFTVISFSILAYLHLSGILSAPSQDKITLSAWLINILLIVIVAIIIAIIQTTFNRVNAKLISDLEQQNDLISEKERNYREIFNASTDAIFIHNLEGEILDVNESMLKMFGFESFESSNLSLSALCSQNEGFNTTNALEYIKKAVNDEPQLFDWQARKKSGELFWVEVALKKTLIGGYERILAVIRDINDRKENSLQLEHYRNHLKDLVAQKTKELERTNQELLDSNLNLAQQKEELIATLNELQFTQKQLVQSEKMASLGILASGIAHEINNPLNFIQGGLYGIENLIEDKLQEHKAEFTPLLKGIEEGINRATRIITSLNHYSSSTISLNEPCEIHSIIDNCLLILQIQINSKARINKEYKADNYELIGNQVQLHQVILNILSNAVQSISENGIINIHSKIIKQDLHIRIKDNGQGISDENLSKIFDPFFTTKEPGKGTGLGMSIALKIINDHKGKIEYNSSINGGTEVVITLPVKITG